MPSIATPSARLPGQGLPRHRLDRARCARHRASRAAACAIANGWSSTATGRFVTQREYPRLALIEPSARARCAASSPHRGWPRSSVPLDRARAARATSSSGAATCAASTQATTPPRGSPPFSRADVRLVRFDPRKPRRCNPDYVGDSGAHTLFCRRLSGARDRRGLARRPERAAASPRASRVADEPLPAERRGRRASTPYDEDHLDTLAVGGVTLRLVKPCTRCQVTTTDQATARGRHRAAADAGDLPPQRRARRRGASA